MKNTVSKALSALILAGLTYSSIARADMKKEFEALEEARQLLTEVKDEDSAKMAAAAIKKSFDVIPAAYGEHTDAVLTQLHDKQNIINRMMILLSKEKYFESSGLQECWALIVHAESRRFTLRKKSQRR